MENHHSKEEELTQQNLGLVISQAKKFNHTSVTDVDDYIQAGSIALLEAIRNFDEKKGNKFASYAYVAIRRSIAREFAQFAKNGITSNLDNAESVAEAEIGHGILSQIMPENITKEELSIIKMRLENRTLEEIGTELGYSKEWISQLLSRAFRKIRKAHE